MSHTLVTLMRHGEVYNPDGVIYERLDGYHLSERGVRMAECSAQFIKNDAELSQIQQVYTSPLLRVQETVKPVLEALKIAKSTNDDRILESKNKIAGKNPRKQAKYLLSHLKFITFLRLFHNPFKPSWGEPYKEIAGRVTSLVNEVLQKHPGSHTLLVFHQSPIWVTRRIYEGKPAWHNPFRRKCALASLTALKFETETGKLIGVRYEDPASGVS